MAKEENRCWPGYEPVKGKSQHEQGSCRKKADSKSSASDKKAQNSRKKQLDTWAAEHPGSKKSAAQHLHAPGTKTKTVKKKAAAKAAKSKSAPRKKKAAAK